MAGGEDEGNVLKTSKARQSPSHRKALPSRQFHVDRLYQRTPRPYLALDALEIHFPIRLELEEYEAGSTYSMVIYRCNQLGGIPPRLVTRLFGKRLGTAAGWGIR